MVKKSRKKANPVRAKKAGPTLKAAVDALDELNDAAERSGASKMSDGEIEAEIRAYRRARARKRRA